MTELLLTLLVLYGLQCMVLLPRGATLFVLAGGRWRDSRGPGYRLLHPWPSAAGWLGCRAPLRERDGALRTPGPTAWLGAGYAADAGVEVRPGAGQQVEVRGAVVRVDGEPALRAASKHHAEAIAELLRAVAAAADAPAAAARLEDWRLRSFAAEELARAREEAVDATRWLARLSALALLAIFGVLPALGAWLGGERTLLLFAPSYAVLHLALLVLLGLAHRRLRPEASDRFELLLSAALYPPLLLRAAADLRRQALCAFHPVAVAAEVLPRGEALERLRRELMRAGGGPERDAVVALIERLGSSPAALLAPPERSDPLARSYCPTCRTEYRLDAGQCVDCVVALAPLPDDDAESAAPSDSLARP